ncbi:pyruvate dehydrogenase (acetyl-transferring) E1 component subunit alpha [Nakamurella sp. YIM 132087]|uniref:2-oxoisovalerate dehydrogenase subunit alpha n=2 Tax=Nakamurella alba TaxID=2665158 RepID=A0A7K1FS07_9ACTN|nr:thiamine pyrophosphate-dependent enzyme [Nakamurella alba]MTD16139.1 pyruvate dehydrogenase (acetyl-transferring) E1 component subunit alpha [Nakamurella alba]
MPVIADAPGPDHPTAPPEPVDPARLYRDMAITRRIDTEAIALQRQGELGLWPSLLGQEAAQVGAAHALQPQDMVFPTYREHGVAWVRGIDPVELLGLFRGTTLGGWDPQQHRMNTYTLVIGAQLLHAVGYAMGIVRDGDVGTGEPGRDRAVLAFLGDGSISEGETNEAFVWAAAQDLPVVFLCQNNQWAISAPFSVQSRVPVARRADGFGFPGIRVDGNDVHAVLDATREALERARAGGGPTLVEALTYRRNPHTTSDDDGRYRSGAENDRWAARDPLALALDGMETGDGRAALLAEVEQECEQVAARLRAGCRALPEPDPAAPFDHTFAEITPELERQRAEHLAFVASLEVTP